MSNSLHYAAHRMVLFHMTVLKHPAPPAKMTVEEFFEWADAREGRYELERGYVVGMAPGNFDHARVKAAAWLALRNAIQRTSKQCEAIVDSVGVTLGDDSCYIPHVVVTCGEPAAGTQRIAPNPIIVIEVTSPSTARLDKTSKLSDYLAIDSIAHYLILDPVSREVIHHRRIDGKRFVTQAIRTGALTLDPPGLTVAIEDIFGANTHASS